MTKYPSVNGKRLLKCLLRKGYLKIRQKGSHVSLRHPIDSTIVTVIQDTSSDLFLGTLECIKRQLKLSRKDFLKILQDS